MDRTKDGGEETTRPATKQKLEGSEVESLEKPRKRCGLGDASQPTQASQIDEVDMEMIDAERIGGMVTTVILEENRPESPAWADDAGMQQVDVGQSTPVHRSAKRGSNDYGANTTPIQELAAEATQWSSLRFDAGQMSTATRENKKWRGPRPTSIAQTIISTEKVDDRYKTDYTLMRG